MSMQIESVFEHSGQHGDLKSPAFQSIRASKGFFTMNMNSDFLR
jgi:hypothetical protein